MSLTVTAWNIRQGGGDRVPRVVHALGALGTDIAVISEWRSSSANRLADLLAVAGFEFQVSQPDPGGGYAAVLIASRTPIVKSMRVYDDAGDGHRFIEFDVTGTPWTIAGVYVPGYERKSDRKRDLWNFLVDRWAPAVADRRVLLCGDLNTGLHYRDELGATFTCSDRLAALESAGWRDAWIERHRQQRPPGTWFSPKFENPFRLDHALLSPGAPRARDVSYPTAIAGSSVLGRGGLSDHLPVVIKL